MAYNKSCRCTDVEIGNTALFYKTKNAKSSSRWRGPEFISDIDETGVTAKFRQHAFKAARFCVRAKVEAEDVEDAEADPMRTRLRSGGLDLGSRQEQVDLEVGRDVDGKDEKCTLSTGVPESGTGPKPEATPAPDSPSFSVRLPSPRGSLEGNRGLESPLTRFANRPGF